MNTILAAVAGGAGRWMVALILLESAVHAARDAAAQAHIVAAYRLLPAWAVAGAARGLPVACVAVALALVAGPAGAVAAAMLLGVFALAMAINLWRGRRHIACGCGGAGQNIAWALVLRNAALMALLGASWRAPLPHGAAVLAAAGLGAGLAALYAAARQLAGNQAAVRRFA